MPIQKLSPAVREEMEKLLRVLSREKDLTIVATIIASLVLLESTVNSLVEPIVNSSDLSAIYGSSGIILCLVARILHLAKNNLMQVQSAEPTEVLRVLRQQKRHSFNGSLLIMLGILLLLASFTYLAGSHTPSRPEFEQLRNENSELQRQIDSLKALESMEEVQVKQTEKGREALQAELTRFQLAALSDTPLEQLSPSELELRRHYAALIQEVDRVKIQLQTANAALKDMKESEKQPTEK